jgi:hypothetical protein
MSLIGAAPSDALRRCREDLKATLSIHAHIGL